MSTAKSIICFFSSSTIYQSLGKGGHNLPLLVPRSPASRTFLSLCLLTPALYCVFLLLSYKSGCLTPYSNRGYFGLVQKKKKGVVDRTTPHFPARSLRRHSFDTSLHHAAIQCFQLWTTVVRSELPGRSSMDGFFPTTPKIMVFDDIWPDLRRRSCREFRQLARQTRHWHERLTQTTHVYMCHAISFMTYDVSDLERFPISQESLGARGVLPRILDRGVPRRFVNPNPI